LSLGPYAHPVLPEVEGRQLEIRATFDPGEAEQWGLEVGTDSAGQETTRIYYDQAEQAIKVDLRESTLSTNVNNKALHTASYPHESGAPMTIHVFMDHSILDVFVDDRKAFSTRIYPSLKSSQGVEMFAQGGAATVEQVDVWRLGSDEPFPDPSEPTGDASGVQLLPNVPNPMRTSTTFGLTVPSARRATVAVYDVLGRHVATLLDRHIEAGTSTVTWTPSQEIASGIYFYRLRADDITRTRKLIKVN
jgi:hypothetical protein